LSADGGPDPPGYYYFGIRQIIEANPLMEPSLDRLEVNKVLRVGATLDSLANECLGLRTWMGGEPGINGWEVDFNHIGNDHISTVGDQLLAIPLPGDPEDQAEPTIATSLNAGDGILNDHSPVVRNSQSIAGGGEDVGFGLAVQPQFRRDHPIHPDSEQRQQAGRFQDSLAVLAGGGYPDRYPIGDELVDKRYRGLEHDEVPTCDDLVETLVLAVAQAANGLILRGVARCPIRQFNAARLQKRSHPLIARFPVHIGEVIGIMGEFTKRGTGPVGVGQEEFIEHLLPGSAVDCGSVGDDAIQVKDDRGKVERGHIL
jgi:hypothetical protein